MSDKGEFIWPVRVYYEDTDCAGVVYYAGYLRFMERARTEWLRSMGVEQGTLAREEGVVFAVRRAELDYLAPARLDDLLEVSVGVLRCAGASVRIHQAVRRRGQGQILCRGRMVIACLASSGFRPCAIPERIAAGIRQRNPRLEEHH